MGHAAGSGVEADEVEADEDEDREVTAAGDRVIELLELGDLFTWVSDDDRVGALRALESDLRIDATITQLESARVLGTLFRRYAMQTDPSLFDLTLTLAARVGTAAATLIEPHLRAYPQFSDQSRRLTDHFGRPSSVFRLANDLSLSLARHGVAPRARTCTREPPPTIPASPSDSFTGSGATGRDIFAQRVPVHHQAGIAWEQAWHDGPDPGAAGPLSRRYSNPLVVLTLPADRSERKSQAARVSCLPISTLFSRVYASGLPTRATVMSAAARLHRLTPEIIGAVILAEQRDQSRNEDMLDYTAATHSVHRRTTSIGLAQVRDDTAARVDLFQDLIEAPRRTSLSERQVAALLTCDEFNIFACARYIRTVADAASGLAPSSLPATVAAFPGINFAAYAGHASTWPPDNVGALGSEYTSKPWDDEVFGWGPFVQQAWIDMNRAGISW